MGATSTAAEDRKQRIVAHMNRGHSRELSHYLRHYAGASPSAASKATLTDMSLTSLAIRARGGDYSIPLSPPMDSLEDARERLVAMDVEARTALGISDVVVDEWVPPTGLAATTLAFLIFYFGCYFTLPWTGPGTTAWKVIDPIFPGGAATFRWIAKTIFWPVILIHLVEAIIFARTRMNKYSVPRWSRVWWLWVVNCAFVGFPTFLGIDELAARKKAEKAGKSH
ncbi:hypothetical protein HJFPF1_06338 [Paramyrothecium foliicola]|nr:hypothetical protein HJFPF1_06338 [Paramyrothecium foliicola]